VEAMTSLKSVSALGHFATVDTYQVGQAVTNCNGNQTFIAVFTKSCDDGQYLE
jgi:hypothetical protein